ncbi:MAG TPA: mechanosensitive ion channel, partial [Aquabacterium sp.]|uniref:mechanosensitive ion channel n=1 Tax=Aquabacterium sp. TaxID=1872578 RepID=UPI002E328716
PRLAGALAIVLAAWIAARLSRAALIKAVNTTGLETRLKTPGLGKVLAQIVSGLVWLFALPALLGTLQLQALLDPVNVMMSRLMGFVPNVFGSVVILGVGVLAARIVRQIVEGVLTAAGSEKLAARLGLQTALGERTLASLAGSVVFGFILLPTLTAAFQTLGLDAIARPVGHMLDAVVDLIPKLVSAAVIVAVGALMGRVVANLLTTVLAGAGINRWPARMGLPENWKLAGRDLSELVGGMVMVAFVMAAITQGCQVLGFAVLTDAVTLLGGVMARLVAAMMVLTLGLWLSAVAAQSIEASGTHQARAWAQAARVAILFFTVALALRQSGLPADIIVIAFGAVVGALSLGLAIALGFGGQDVAARVLSALADRYTRLPEAGRQGGDQGGDQAP